MRFYLDKLYLSKQLLALLLWTSFIGAALWQHAQQSQQPPIYDASTYYVKAYNFWTNIGQPERINPFNIEPSFRPPGTILMAYPFGFEIDYRGFYFRSVFFPIALLVIAVVVAGYQRNMESKNKWHLVLFAAFFSVLPAFYYFEVSPDFPALTHWGLVDNFLAGMAAMSAATLVRSIRTHSLVWLGVAAVLSSFCLLIKPTGALVMVLIGLTWFGLSAAQLRLTWESLEKRKNGIQWLVIGMAIFAVPYLLVLLASFQSDYLSAKNLAFGSAAIVVMKSELMVTLPAMNNMVHLGLGYSFIMWLLLMAFFVNRYFYITSKERHESPSYFLKGMLLAAGITFLFGIWFWIFGSGGVYQIRYFIPFLLIAGIFALPVVLAAVRTLRGWRMALLSLTMIAPVVNTALLLPQRVAPTEWQKWSGVNLSSGAPDAVLVQAENFVNEIKREGRHAVLYSMPMNVVDASFQAVIDYERVAMHPMPSISIARPVDWQRPTTYRLKDLLEADYWLLEPARDPDSSAATLAIASVDSFDQERAVFQTWATQLTPKDGVALMSETPTARLLQLTDKTLLEAALNELVAQRQWRGTFLAANPKRRFSEADLVTELKQHPSILENINFSDRFHVHALSVSETKDDTTIRIWWKPLAALPEKDWVFFIHLLDEKGEIRADHYVPFKFDSSLSSLNGVLLLDQITFKSLPGNRTMQLGVGLIRPGEKSLVADNGTRDWENRRVLIKRP